MDAMENSGFEAVPAQVVAVGATVGVEEAARLLGIGRTLAYRLAAAVSCRCR